MINASPATPSPVGQSATDRLEQLLKELQADQVIKPTTTFQPASPSSIATSAPSPAQSAQVAYLASALSNAQPKSDWTSPATSGPLTPTATLPATPSLSSPIMSTNSVPNNSAVTSGFGTDTDRFQQVMSQVQQRYAQSKPSLAELLRATKGSVSSSGPISPLSPPIQPNGFSQSAAKPVSVTPSPVTSTWKPAPSAVSAPVVSPPVMPVVPPAPTKSGLKAYVAKLASHLSQHGRLVLTDYRVGGTV
jgi:hypothetical protein